MNVVVEIKGRAAVPVRALPLLTDWETLSPDVCARAFANDPLIFYFERAPATYRVAADGAIEPVPERWWKNWVVRQLDACSERIKSEQIGHESGYEQWRQESLSLLPAGVFVWRDEFEKAYFEGYGPNGTMAWSKQINGLDYEADKYTLNFSPQPTFLIDWEALVMEGFGAPADGNATLGEDVKSSASASQRSRGTPKRWTDEELEKLCSYRREYGTKAAAEKFNISRSRVRGLLPGGRKQRKSAGHWDQMLKRNP